MSDGHPPEENLNMKRLYVHNVPFSLSERDLEDEFAKFGHIIKCQVPKNEYNKPKG